MSKFLGRSFILAISLAVIPAPGSRAFAGLTFNFTAAPGTSQQAIDGFNRAGQLWSGVIADNITVNINIGYTPLAAGVLSQGSSTQNTYSYSSVRNALIADATSASDLTSSAALNAGAINMLINGTSNNPNGSGSTTPYLDNTGANSSTIRMTNANAKALGLLSATNAATDASITLSSNFSFDFDHNPATLSANRYDFVGIAAREIGRALGFISGVDVLDLNSPPPGGTFSDNAFTFVSTLDLFRYSTLSYTQGLSTNGVAAIDWTADNRTKYFSVDGGLTSTGSTFSTGVYKGDGNQAGSWKDNLGIGIMDPTAAPGEFLSITARDLRAFDVIGYNLQPSSVPEPTSLAMLGLGLASVGLLTRIRRRA